jgi:hypothetical protein
MGNLAPGFTLAGPVSMLTELVLSMDLWSVRDIGTLVDSAPIPRSSLSATSLVKSEDSISPGFSSSCPAMLRIQSPISLCRKGWKDNELEPTGASFKLTSEVFWYIVLIFV